MDQKQLKALIKVLRENGIVEYTSPECSFKFVYEAMKLSKPEFKQNQDSIPTENPYSDFPDGELSPSQLAFYSAGGDPSDDPEGDN